MTDKNIVLDLSEHYGDVEIAQSDDSIGLLSCLPILKRNWLPCSLIFLSVFGASILASVLLPGSTSYKSSGKLLFQASDAKSELTGIAENLDPLESTGVLSNPLSTQSTILTSGFLIEDVISSLDLRNEEGDLVGNKSVLENLAVEQLPATDILKVAYQSDDPQLAAQVVNELMRLYVLFIEQEQKAEIVAAKTFVDEQLPRLKADLNFASRALEQFKAENQVVALDRQAAEITSLLTGLDQQLNDTLVSLTAVNAQAADLSQQLNIDVREAIDLSTVNEASGVQDVLEQLHAVETELSTQRGLYLPQHPTVINLQNQADKLAELLQERVNIVLSDSAAVSLQDLQLGSLQQSLLSDLVKTESDRILLETQLEAFNDLKRDYTNKATLFPSLERRQFELQQNLTNAQSSYDELLKRSQEIKLAEIQIDGSNYVQIIENARPPKEQTSAFNPLVLSAGTFLALGLAVATGLLLDRIDKSVKSVSEFTRILNYPLLGLVPEFNKALEGNSLGARSISQETLEIYRGIYSSLKVANFDSPAKIITVTSSVHGEGKSEVTANLAAAIAHSRRRVLLIDADLRKPVQHELWRIDNDAGLSHLLSEKSALEESIHQLSPHLSVMTAGLAVAEPSLFFESTQMKEMLNQVKEEYDYIIFDAAPILPEPDVLMLGQVSEGIVFVGQPKYVRKADVVAANQLMEKAKLSIIGLVVNRVSRNEQQENRAPFSNVYRVAGENPTYQGDFQNAVHDGDTGLKTSANKVFSNSGLNSRR
ncbi:GumC family protein [Leptothoe spongobia]|uniref:Polysaccharide biosynthesis tyrosine autokinase n=1 Tax=Leptothoe spongobia TAU-MAC 1115 TaxID=1967444 RepID=A0A947DKK7_9CYAN|nr:polysaccharide biosynthesis tyrosine autokinase [Leptothoe spongobia]MBT9317466.1 polysaccharide biosynthesis tyrosine autokinase [Leptothoe spongobia TAU-MAC 1115]